MCLTKRRNRYEEKSDADKVWSKCKDIAEIFRETSNITGIPLRSVLGEFGKKGMYIRYGEDDLKEDIE